VELWIATGNAKKRAELERLLAPLDVAVRSQAEAPGAPEVVEDRPDFAGNAEKKAATLARFVGGVAVADDSGLSVDALDGRPGVLSARYAGPDASDADRVAKLLREMAGHPEPAQRTARFTCSLALCGPDGAVRAKMEEHCEGWILHEPRGSGGFGYDPVFVATSGPEGPDGETPAFAELTSAQKDAISHRGKALRRLVELLSKKPALLEP